VVFSIGDVVKIYATNIPTPGQFVGIGIYLGAGTRGVKKDMPEFLWNTRVATFDPQWWQFEVVGSATLSSQHSKNNLNL
jgi:hypothetical protein